MGEPLGPSDGPAPVINLRQVTKIYRSGSLAVAALRGIDLEVASGESVAIVGPSGSGKSTLMHIIGCLDLPTSGTYLLGGEDVGSMSDAALAQVRNRRVGFVFQQFNLLGSMSALRNVELPLLYAAVPRPTRRRRALEALEVVGLADRVHHKPGQLSGGQQQRVAIARAIVTDPDVILADEPTGNLDSAAARDVTTLLAELHASGKTFVLITHEAQIASTAQRIVRLRDGLVSDEHESLVGGERL